MADLIAAFCIRRGTDRVLDPSCGEGGFLLRSGLRLARLGSSAPSLTGVELDPELARVARGRLPEAAIVAGDFLELTRAHSPFPPFDAVVGNPPYVRHELLAAGRKHELAALSALPGRPHLAGRCDLHAWFWAPAIACLRPGGRLGWVVSSTWLDASYGDSLRGWLARETSVAAVIESDVESWFDEARVRTVVMILERREGGPAAAPGQRLRPRPSEVARFCRIGRRLDEIAPRDLDERRRADRLAELAAELEAGGRVRRARESVAARPARRPPPGEESAGAAGRGALFVVRTVSRRSLAEGPWGAILRATDLCRELIARAGDRLVPLGEVATVRWGIKTGDDAVFFPTAAAAGAARLERAVLRPAAFSLMEMDRLIVPQWSLRRRLLLIDTREPAHRALLARPGSGVAAWLARARKQRASHRRPTVAARERPRTGRRWFELRPGAPGAILWSVMHQYRHLAPLNPRGAPANDNFLLVDPVPGVEARLLGALLNSHVQALLKHAAGRQRNEGMLKTQAADARRMLVPDPRRLAPVQAARIAGLFDPLARRRIGTVSEEGSRPDRRRLDEAVLGALGVSPGERRELAARLAADLKALHERERRWETDAVARRRKGQATG